MFSSMPLTVLEGVVSKGAPLVVFSSVPSFALNGVPAFLFHDCDVMP